MQKTADDKIRNTTTKNAKLENKPYVQAPNTKIALAILQLKDFNFNMDDEKWRIKFFYIPTFHTKEKIMALILSKMLDAYDIKRKSFKDKIFINVKELVEIQVADKTHPSRTIDKLDVTILAITSAKLTRPLFRGGADEAFPIFGNVRPCYKTTPRTQKQKLIGYYVDIVKNCKIVKKLWQRVLCSYGNFKCSVFSLTGDAFLIAYFLATNPKLATKSYYEVSVDEILDNIAINGRRRTPDKKRLYPLGRVREAINVINNSDVEIRLYEDKKKPDNFVVTTKRLASQKLNFADQHKKK